MNHPSGQSSPGGDWDNDPNYPLIDGQEPTPIPFDPDSPFSELYRRLGSGECLKCARPLAAPDWKEWAPWCQSCAGMFSTTVKGFFGPMKHESLMAGQKICKKCGRSLPVLFFAVEPEKVDGLQNTCRECFAVVSKRSRTSKRFKNNSGIRFLAVD